MLDNGDRFEIRRESRHDREVGFHSKRSFVVLKFALKPPVHHNQSTPKIEEVICSEDDEDNRLEAGRSRANVVVEEPDEIHSTIAPASIPERRVCL
ncbi:hypothetical protein BVRB_025160 [Beta vulgaris subsp. vulgaris]|uniref:Uncharacterized protein n=1 Tax=Beta vulgaris subsp. vulgaris TaxID=3555 RepID=A0A0J8AZ78_BETVV|nr:hypothetical protein BVRB_025160 [Beta vulgaris subsp. vulgaris]